MCDSLTRPRPARLAASICSSPVRLRKSASSTPTSQRNADGLFRSATTYLRVRTSAHTVAVVTERSTDKSLNGGIAIRYTIRYGLQHTVRGDRIWSGNPGCEQHGRTEDPLLLDHRTRRPHRARGH